MGGNNSKNDSNKEENDNKVIGNGVTKERKKPEYDREEVLGDKPEELTNEEKEMIKETWKDVENSVAKVGAVMFIK